MADQSDEEIIIEEEEPSTVARRIRVYKGGDEDFFLDIPADCRLTFGYFNPAASGNRGDQYGNFRPGAGSETMKTTCLRIYRGKGTTNQLAAFLGVRGFRDETIKLTKLVQKVVVEKRMVNDGEGTVEWNGSQQRELTVSVEDEDIPF